MAERAIKTLLVVAATGCIGCGGVNSTKGIHPTPSPSWVVDKRIDSLLQLHQVEGSIVVFDPAAGTHYTNDSIEARAAYLPASTYKVPHSVIALATGVIADSSTVIPWDGGDYFLDVWEQDLTFAQALRFSCVPCYRRIARSIGAEQMRRYLDSIDYPGMVFDSTSVDGFWLRGPSAISALEQVEFLRRLRENRLPISPAIQATVVDMMHLESRGRASLHGKTGWAMREDAPDIGWFVGFVRRPEGTVYVATRILPTTIDAPEGFVGLRREVTEEVLEGMGWW